MILISGSGEFQNQKDTKLYDSSVISISKFVSRLDIKITRTSKSRHWPPARDDTMKLYTADYAPNPRRVRWVMAEKGIADIAVETVDLMALQHKRHPGVL